MKRKTRSYIIDMGKKDKSSVSIRGVNSFRNINHNDCVILSTALIFPFFVRLSSCLLLSQSLLSTSACLPRSWSRET